MFVVSFTIFGLLHPPPAHAGVALQRVHHWRDVTWHLQDAGAWPRAPYRWVADRRSTSVGERWRIAIEWYGYSRHVTARLAELSHGSSVECYAFAARRFAPLGVAAVQLELAILHRESHCTWWARNSSSTAAGPEQFLDHWGPLGLRMNVVWSINRAFRAVRDGGWSPWAPLP